jgi:hypothetical protein
MQKGARWAASSALREKRGTVQDGFENVADASRSNSWAYSLERCACTKPT